MVNKRLIVFLAPSGVGKSTSANYLAEKHQGEIIKLASPLYELQSIIHQKINHQSTGQDGELLQFLGHKIQKLKPTFLFDEFKKKYDASSGNLIINDDCRPHNYQYLKSLGAIFVKIQGPSRDRPEDTSALSTQHPVEWQGEIPSDYRIFNLTTKEALFNQLDQLMEKICG